MDRRPGWHAAVAASSARVADVAATKIAATNIPAHCGPSLATTSRPLRQTQHSRAIGPCLNRLVNERGWRGCRDLPRRRNRTPDHRRGCHQRSQRRNRRSDHRRSECVMKGAVRPPSKGPAWADVSNRRPARCKNGEDAGRNSNGHRTRSTCVVNGPPSLFRLIRRSQGASCSDLLSQSSLLEWAAS